MTIDAGRMLPGVFLLSFVVASYLIVPVDSLVFDLGPAISMG